MWVFRGGPEAPMWGSKLPTVEKGGQKLSCGGEGKLCRVCLGYARGTRGGEGKSNRPLEQWSLPRGRSCTTRKGVSTVCAQAHGGCNCMDSLAP